jgi:rod shape-determining protein MreB
MLFEEPTIAAVDDDTGRLLAFGDEAIGLGVTSAGRVVLMHPVRNGELVDVHIAEDALVKVLRRVGTSRVSRPRMIVCSHVGEMDVQLRALDRALHKAGARQVHFVERPIACAIGADLAIAEPMGTMVIDVGGGTTDIGVLALGGIVTGSSIPVGGNAFDDAVRMVLARHYGLIVEPSAATHIVHTIGTLDGIPGTERAEVSGRDASSGRAHAVTVLASDLTPFLKEVAEPIVLAAVECITSAPPDLANDLLDAGLVLAGGAASLDGFGTYLARATGVAVHPAPQGGRLGVLGAARCASMLEALGAAISGAPRR